MINPETKPVHDITLGSTSAHKLNAIKTACTELGLEIKLGGVAVESEINDQPYGLEETYAGAMNRAKNTQKETLQSIVIGIESGLVPLADKYLDMAVVVVLTPDGQTFTSTSAGIEFPAVAVEAARAKGFDHHTAGSEVAAMLGGSPTDPHSTLTNGQISRQELLVEAIKTALSRAIPTL